MAHHASSTATALKRKCPEPDEEETAGLCTDGCGFHGAAATANMCSKCYREHVATTAADNVFIAPAAAASTEPPEKKAKTTVSVVTPSDGGKCSGTAQKSKCPEPKAEATAAAVMCANGCGFHGAAATANMCSKCYREHVAITAAYSVFLVPPENKAKTIVPVASSDGGAVESAVKQPVTAAASRCATCRKKVGLLGFRCRCEGTFCSAHRYAEKHDCGFDHKTAGREKITEYNPVVVADKMTERI